MSDLQILTGLSIMISGFAQLHCGISCYHWQLLTYLAWFSSLTHMACLTFLRQYLYMHQSQRAWRLLAMGILVIMLFVALIPSGAYNWSTRGSSNDADPGPADYAICYLTQFGHSEPMTLGSMILSVLVVSLGYLSRVTRLHKILAIDGLAKARHKGSLHARALLKRVYTWSDAGTSTKRLAKLILYRPLLGVFLVFRVIIDAWSSMFVEVSRNTRFSTPAYLVRYSGCWWPTIGAACSSFPPGNYFLVATTIGRSDKSFRRCFLHHLCWRYSSTCIPVG